jgi:hypothetical protein
MFEMATPEWFKQHHSPEYVRYVAASLPPTRSSAADLAAARADLLATPMAREIVAEQRADGGWDPDVPEIWYRSVPRRLEILIEYGFTPLDEPLARGLRYLLSRQQADGTFRPEEPEAIPFDEAYNAACLRVLVAAGLRSRSETRLAAERLLAARRHDGGWSTLPVWFRQPGVPLPDPEPSCPICTNLAVFALGAALDLPASLRDELLSVALTVGPTLPPAARAAQWRERLVFAANQGLQAGDPLVDDAVAGLAACREADGRFGHHESPADYVPPELAEALTRHVLWRVGAWTADDGGPSGPSGPRRS